MTCIVEYLLPPFTQARPRGKWFYRKDHKKYIADLVKQFALKLVKEPPTISKLTALQGVQKGTSSSNNWDYGRTTISKLIALQGMQKGTSSSNNWDFGPTTISKLISLARNAEKDFFN